MFSGVLSLLLRFVATLLPLPPALYCQVGGRVGVVGVAVCTCVCGSVAVRDEMILGTPLPDPSKWFNWAGIYNHPPSPPPSPPIPAPAPGSFRFWFLE